MNPTFQDLRDLLTGHHLKVTPQRLAVLEAMYVLQDHPTADRILDWVRERHPGVASGTIYNTLESLVEKGLLVRVRTEAGKMRYDIILNRHHHLYCSDSDRIEDYFDPELDAIIDRYFKDRRIPGFDISGIKLEIKGKFK